MIKSSSFVLLNVLLTAGMFVASCKSDVFYNSDVETIEVDFRDLKSVSCDEVIDSIRFVKLETTEKSLIGNIDNIFFVDSTIVVFDEFVTNSANLFDLNGKFKKRLSNKGNGPKEYLKISDLFIDKNRIGIKDNLKSRILFYDCDGNYLETVKTPYVFGDIRTIDEDKYILHLDGVNNTGGKEYDKSSFVIVDKQFKPLYGIVTKLISEDFSWSYINNYFPNGNEMMCIADMQDDIYLVNSKGYKAKYKFVIKPNNLYDQTYWNDEEFTEMSKYYSRFNGSFIELEDLSYFSLIKAENGRSYFTNGIIYSHKTHLTKILDMVSSDPLMMFFNNTKTGYKNNTLVSVSNANNIISIKQQLIEKGGYNESMAALCDGLTVDSNPVLFFYDIDINE